MTFTLRTYPEIVRDLLTVMTGGTVAETLDVGADDDPLRPRLLADRPVRRVSHLEGFVELKKRTGDTELVPYRFGPSDFELIASNGDDALDAIRFRKQGRKPAPGTRLTINYYPLTAERAPISDIYVGSVARTMMETVARELAEIHLRLDSVYRSAFVETAEGQSLDRVVALAGMRRLGAGHPVARLRFTRGAGHPGRITVPAGTAVTDRDGNRYLTVADVTLEPNETTREIDAVGESAATPAVAEERLTSFEVMLAGVDRVTNPVAATRSVAGETDDDLRRRARGALHGRVKGTLPALRFALLSIRTDDGAPALRDVQIVEQPNGVPGEVRVDIAFADDSAVTRQRVDAIIEDTRPVGVRVLRGEATRVRVRVNVTLTLAQSVVPSQLQDIQRGVESRVHAALTRVEAGGRVRRARLAAAALEDALIVDASIYLSHEGQPAIEELLLEQGQVLDVVRPFSFSPPEVESQAGAPAAQTVARVNCTLPVHLLVGVASAQATEAIQAAAAAHIASRRPGLPLTLDTLAAAIRDDSKFVLVRADALIVVESDGRFVQLTDGIGTFEPAALQTLEKGTITVDVREGQL